MSNNKKKYRKKSKKSKHPFIKLFLLLILLILVIIATYFTYGTIKNGGGLKGFLSTAIGQTAEEAENLEPISALILGSSQNMTDTIMIAKYNPKTQQAYLLSLPRDTFVGTSKNSAKTSEKLNSLYQGKYPEKTLAAVNKLTGLSIEYYVVVDTEALRALVDAIGGVEFDVPINMKYTDKKQNLYINLKKGIQKLDGKKAEQLVRFRHNQNGTTYSAEYGDNDIGRMKTQRNFLKAVMRQTLKPSNIFKIKEFIDISKKYVKTNISFDLLKQYVPSAVNFDTENLETDTLSGTPEKCNGLWLFILDKTKTKTYIEELDQKLMNEQEITSTETSNNTNSSSSSTQIQDKSQIKIELLNSSGSSSNLTKVTNSLKEKGYTISKVGKTNSTAKTSIINKGNVSENILKNIKEIIGVGAISTGTSNSSSTSITIILGKDFKK